MTQRTPFDDITDLFEQLSEELDEVGAPLEGAVGSEVRVDLLERDGEFVLTADLPGFARDDIEVTVTDRRVTLQADREETIESETEPDDDRFHRRERRRQSVSRRVALPGEVAEADASATYEHGVLTVTLPKPVAPGEDGTRIDVE